MLHDARRREQGSTFCLPELGVGQSASLIGLRGNFVGSGRIALKQLLHYGHQFRGWQRLWIPSYYCDDVVASLHDSPVDIMRYPCGPWDGTFIPEVVRGDVLLRVSYFNWGITPFEADPGCDVIEDHTHDPHAGLTSRADFVFASLRKNFPIPDGGVLWSPRGHALPAVPALSVEHEASVLKRLSAMAMKRSYLSGNAVEKEGYRVLETEAESLLLEGSISGMTSWSKGILDRLPFEQYRVARGENYKMLSGALVQSRCFELVGPKEQAFPFMAIVAFKDQAIRDRVRDELITRGIYPAVLWPVSDPEASWIGARELDFSRRTMALHIDARYTSSDMQWLASTVNEIVETEFS